MFGLCFVPATSQLNELGWRHVRICLAKKGSVAQRDGVVCFGAHTNVAAPPSSWTADLRRLHFDKLRSGKLDAHEALCTSLRQREGRRRNQGATRFSRRQTQRRKQAVKTRGSKEKSNGG